ncbi:MAG: Inner membrane ABC transporter permease protein YejE [Holosporales bacterium]
MVFMKFSPLTIRKIEQFKTNKRAYFSLKAFLCLFILSLFSEFIANENPIIVCYKNHFYFPIFEHVPETTYGGTFETAANYHDQVVIDLIQKDGWMIKTPIPFSPNTINFNLQEPAPAHPSFVNWLGTDDQGRDIFARLLYGFRMSILFGLSLTFGSLIIGIIAGSVQGYFGGRIDLYMQRFIEIWSGLPILYLLIILSSMVSPNIFWLLGIMMCFSWIGIVGVVRAEFFRTRSLDFVKAAYALGVPNYLIIWRHILPNAIVATITYIPFILNGSIALLTSLDFLGFGLPPGSPSLGELITQAKNNIHAPWIGMTIFIFLSLLLSFLIFIGEGIRDAFDSRKGAQLNFA